MNKMGLCNVSERASCNFTQDPFCSYFDDCQKNEIQISFHKFEKEYFKDQMTKVLTISV